MSDAESPAEAGRELQDPETMSDREHAQQGAQAAQAINDFGSLYPRQQTRFVWSVLNTNGSDGVSVHSVDTRHLECTCEDHTFNRESGEGDVCKHVAAALYASPRKLDAEADGLWTLTTMLSDAREAKSEIESIRDLYRTLRDAETAAVESAESDERPSLEETTPDPDVDPSEAAETLQQAFDDACDGMNVEAAAGKVWVNKTPEAPDWTFSAFLSEPEQTVYVHDDHDMKGEEPGEWFSNYLEPSDVEEYIAEVLE